MPSSHRARKKALGKEEESLNVAGKGQSVKENMLREEIKQRDQLTFLNNPGGEKAWDSS